MDDALPPGGRGVKKKEKASGSERRHRLVLSYMCNGYAMALSTRAQIPRKGIRC